MHMVSKNPRGMYSRATQYTAADALIDVREANPHLPVRDLLRAVAETLRPGLRRRKPLHKLIPRAA